MNNPALLAATLLVVDQAIGALLRAQAALEEIEWEQENAPELHEEAQGQGGTSTPLAA